ncbi:MAG: cupin domain-containing protein [Candidatus Dadabacteria bacterium]|nr:MAG: cupin domain-containing protein [Candidatus Dadabacteria bacterium]
MRIGNVETIEAKPVEMEGAAGVTIRVVIGEAQGAPHFVMRVFDVEPGGHTPYHTHGFEHEVFVLSGHGSLVEEGRSEPLGPGDVVYVAPGVLHQFRAAEDEGLRFICVVPKP